VKKVAIVTNFRGYDPAYGLCRYVKNLVKILVRGGYKPRLIVRKGFDHRKADNYSGAEIVEIDPGKTGANRVRVTEQSEQEIIALENQLYEALKDRQVAFTHDLIFQKDLWKYHVAARRLTKRLTRLQWLHVVHSASLLNTASKTKQYRRELKGKFPNSRLIIFDREATNRYGTTYQYEVNEMVVIPVPVDFISGFHPLTKEIIKVNNLMRADIIIVYPCRLDRGKQPDIVIEVAAELVKAGFDTRVILANSYSNAGDKAAFREELRRQAKKASVPLVLTSDYDEARVRTPHQVVMDLFELGDILIQPSRSESYSRILTEAAWKRCGLVLNFDLPIFRQYNGEALLYKFSSDVDTGTGMFGSTESEYKDREAYMRHVAAGVAHLMINNSSLSLHRLMRQERSLEGVWPRYWAAIEGIV
jgi:glycosyltransferase involved in cell wall biosynthesis